MLTIIPYLWFNDQAEEAASFHVSIFENAKNGSKIGKTTRYNEASARVSGRPQGSVMTVNFQLEGQDFVALNGGPEFNFSPAISLFVTLENTDEIDRLWGKLSEGGTVMMELGECPHSEKYGWVQDRYGVSWQLMLGSRAQKIAPCLLFVGERFGKAEAAIHSYTSIFPNSNIVHLERSGPGEPNPEGAVKYASFKLNGYEFIAMESAMKEHAFTFTPAISFLVSCETRSEVDYFWDKLREGGDERAQVCGWLQDKYGVSWQVAPKALFELLADSDPEKSERVTEALLKMKKLDIDALKRAAEISLSGS